MDANTVGPAETREQQIERMARKLYGRTKMELVREYLRYQMAKTGKLPHNLQPEFIDVSMGALKRALEDRYGVNNRTLLRLLSIARKKIRPKPFV